MPLEGTSYGNKRYSILFYFILYTCVGDIISQCDMYIRLELFDGQVNHNLFKRVLIDTWYTRSCYTTGVHNLPKNTKYKIN